VDWDDVSVSAPPDELAVDGLLLRRLTKQDAVPLQSAIRASREHLVPFMPFASADPDHLEFRRQWIAAVAERFDQGSSFNYGVLKNGAVVGGCSIDSKPHGAASIGYWVHVDHTRRGYATAVARALRDAAVDAGFSPVLLRHDQANIASKVIAKRLGFRFLRSEPHSIDAPGQTGTSLVWAFEPRRTTVT
jgi:RimJ/RimL family protein N-acetyltransferase